MQNLRQMNSISASVTFTQWQALRLNPFMTSGKIAQIFVPLPSQPLGLKPSKLRLFPFPIIDSGLQIFCLVSPSCPPHAFLKFFYLVAKLFH